jgi:hypothetical protein
VVRMPTCRIQTQPCQNACPFFRPRISLSGMPLKLVIAGHSRHGRSTRVCRTRSGRLPAASRLAMRKIAFKKARKIIFKITAGPMAVQNNIGPPDGRVEGEQEMVGEQPGQDTAARCASSFSSLSTRVSHGRDGVNRPAAVRDQSAAEPTSGGACTATVANYSDMGRD